MARHRERPVPVVQPVANSVTSADEGVPPVIAPPSPAGDKPGYDVGYKKPPPHKQFKKGQSGNPKGRPKREATIQGAIDKELAATVKIREGGSSKAKVFTKAEVIAKQVVNGAVSKDPKSIDQLLRRLSPSPSVAPAPENNNHTGWDELTEADYYAMAFSLEQWGGKKNG